MQLQVRTFKTERFCVCKSHAQQKQLQLFACCLWSNISRASDKLRAHSIQALLKKAENANGFPSHPQVFSAVAVISAEKSCPCLGTQAGSFPHCFFLYYFFFFPPSNVISHHVHLPWSSSGWQTPKHQRSVIIAVQLGSIPARHDKG